MSAAAARQKAERLFALARSTTFPHERDSAIAKGAAIAEAAGLDLDTFDIPGRIKRAAGAQPGFTFTRHVNCRCVVVDLESEDLSEALARFGDALRDANWLRR